MSKILEALEKVSRQAEPDALRMGNAWTRGLVALSPVARPARLSEKALRKMGWVSALRQRASDSRAYVELADHLRSRQPAPARILVTGVRRGVGTTSASLNLATELALSGAATALWCELPGEHARIRDRLGPSCRSGLWDNLQRGTPVREVLLTTHIPGLLLLPGRGTTTPELTMPTVEDVDRCLLDVRNRYNNRYVVIDAPPPEASHLTPGLASRCELAVLVVPAGCKEAAAKAAREALAGAPYCAVLLNRVPRALMGRAASRGAAA